MDDAPSFRISTWLIIMLGSTLRSVEPTAPREPAGDTRRPLSRTRVRVAPNPRSDSVFTPGPPLTTKPPYELSICEAPPVTVLLCNTPAVEANPATVVSSRVITWIGDTELKASLAMREPVTVILSKVLAE